MNDQFAWFQTDIHSAWVYNLSKSFYEISNKLYSSSLKHLNAPNFAINADLNHRWAEWHKDSRTIVFSLRLLKDFEWAAVEYVMKHEVAHQVVDEVFAVEGMTHGPAWERACILLDIPPNVTNSALDLSAFKGGNPTPMIETIRKLLVKGNDAGISKEEATLFLNKAQELMIKHNVSLHSIQGNESSTFYTIRPVGPVISCHKSWIGFIANLIAEYYNIQYIWMGGKQNRRIEFFGTPSNLDVAEYVFHALITQADKLWDDFYDNHLFKLKTDILYADRMRFHRVSKTSFMHGLVDGYRSTLSVGKRIVYDTISASDQAIILANDKLLRQHFEKHYHPTNLAGCRIRGAGYTDGHVAGKNMKLSMGISRGSCKTTYMLS